MKSAYFYTLVLLVGACGGTSRSVGFGDDAGPAMGDDAGGLTGLHGGAGSPCGGHGELNVGCSEGLVCVMGVCEMPSTADAGGVADASVDVRVDADAKPAIDADTGPAPRVHQGPPILAVGGEHSCVLRGGVVECWGSNYAGDLGIGGSSTGPQSCTDVNVGCSPAPLAATGFTAAVDSISAAGAETCALLAGGTLACWGMNDYGQLGNGNTSGPQQCTGIGACATTPLVVPGLSGVSAVATSGSEVCAVLSGGAVDCWGDNLDGEVGNGTVAPGNLAGGYGVSVPTRVSGLTGATAVAVGDDYVCALMQGGSVQCWGSNADGQLGNGSTTNSTTPVPVSNITGAATIAAAGRHTCGLMPDGTVVCWGRNGSGELGLGNASGPQTCANSDPCAPTPAKIPNLSGVTAIAAGGGGTCALLSDATVRCWGWNDEGELGNGTQTQSSTPVAVSGLNGVIEIAMGGFGACALLVSGDVMCWGDNDGAALGSGVAITGPEMCSGGSPCSTTPVKIAGL